MKNIELIGDVPQCMLVIKLYLFTFSPLILFTFYYLSFLHLFLYIFTFIFIHFFINDLS
jgi:hypothetical protein